MANTADLIVIGAGVMGLSAAYHLARRGYGRVTVLERADVSAGSTGQANGGIRHQFSDPIGVELTQRSMAFFDAFQDEFGIDLPFTRCGYLYLVRTERQLATFELNVVMQRGLGVDVQLLSADETKRRFPFLNTDDLLGASYSPNDGESDPRRCTEALAAKARQLGVTIETGCEVLGLRRSDSRLSGVSTSLGDYTAPAVLIAAGPWSGQLGLLAGVDIPVVPRRREQFTTGPFPREQIPETPYILDQAGGFTLRREGEGILMGTTLDIPSTFDTTPNRAAGPELLATVARRCPAVAGATIGHAMAGLLEVTPDHAGIISAVVELDGLYVLAGFSGHGYMHAPIAGQLMSEIIADGRAHTVDATSFSLERFASGGEVHVDAMSPFAPS